MKTDWQEVDCGWFEKTDCNYYIRNNDNEYFLPQDREQSFSVVDNNAFDICDVPTFAEAVEVVEYLESFRERLNIKK